MNAFIGLFDAVAVAAGLLLVFAFLRRVMRSPKPPAMMDSTIFSFALALLLTLAMMLSLMFLGFKVFPFVGSVAMAGMLTLALHLIMWSGVRLIVPLHHEAVVVGHSILDGGNLPVH